MELKEFVSSCIDKAETAHEHGDLEESMRLLNLAADTIKKQAGDISKKRYSETRPTKS